MTTNPAAATTPGTRPARRPFRPPAIALAMAGVAAAGLVLLGISTAIADDGLATLAQAVAEAGAAGALVVAGLRGRGLARAAWLLLAAGIAVWAVTDTIAALATWAGAPPGDLGPFDVGWLASYGPQVAGAVCLYVLLRPERDWEGLLDAILFSVVVALLVVELVLDPALDELGVHGALLAVNLAYPVVDLLVAGMLGWLVAVRRPVVASVAWAFAAALTQSVAGSAYLVTAASGSEAGQQASDALYVGAPLLWAVAALMSATRPEAERPPERRRESPVVAALVPFACLVVVMVVTIAPTAADVAVVLTLGLGLIAGRVALSSLAARRAEQELAASEARHRSVFEGAPDAILTMTAEGVVTSFNAAAERVFGWPAGEAAGRPVSDLFPDGFQNQHARFTSVGLEVTGQRRDGRRVPLLLTISDVRIGDEMAYTIVTRDLTELRAAEEALRAEKDRAEAVLAAMSDGILVLDAGNAVLDVNDRFLEMTGYFREELVGASPPYGFWPPEDAQSLDRLLAEMKDLALVDRDVTLRRTDETTFPAAVSVRHVRREDDGVTTTHVVSVSDITARKEAERRLAESEASFRLLAENATDIVARLDPSGCTLYASPAVESVLGFAPYEIVGTDAHLFAHPDDRAAVMRARASLRRPDGPESVVYTYRHRSADGGWVWLETGARAIRDDDRRLVEIQATARDVTERRRREVEEAALRRVASAVAAEAEPEAVLALVAHEAAQILETQLGVVMRLIGDGDAEVVGSWCADSTVRAPGVLVRSGDSPVIDAAVASGRPVRATAVQASADDLLMAAPVSVGGRTWGVIGVGGTDRRELPHDSGTQLERFADLVGLAIANTDARQQLEMRASHDELTGLPNQRTFHERLDEEVDRALRYEHVLAFAIFDIDRFKSVNDTHGHPVGDMVLREVAARMRPLVRATDTLARAGGEEFVVLLPESDAAGALMVAERLRAAIEAEPFPVVGRVTMSGGVADTTMAGDARTLYRIADEALYASKTGGRNRVTAAAPPPAVLPG